MKWIRENWDFVITVGAILVGFIIAVGLSIANPWQSQTDRALVSLSAQGYNVISYAAIKTCRALSCETTSLVITTPEGNHQCFIDGSAPVCIPLAEGQLPR